MLSEHFPQEEALLGTNPEAVVRVLNRAHTPFARFVLGLLRLFGRPVFRFFVVEADDGRLAATALLTFAARAGYIGAVVVDTPYRRRGYARQILARCHEATRRAGKLYNVLDVLETNEPARRLYFSLRYRSVRRLAFLSRPLSLGERIAPPAPLGVTLRPFRRSDSRALFALAREQLPPEVAAPLPVEEDQFRLPPAVARTLESESEAWVALDPRSRRPLGFVRASVAPLTAAANLTAPLLAPDLSDADGRALVRTALAWLAPRDRLRVVTEIPEYNPRGRTVLEAEGFGEAHRLDTLVRPVAA